MANKTLKFVLVKNGLPTVKDPYNGQFVSNGTTALDAFAEKVCAGRTNIDAPTLKLILRTAFAFVAEDMAENVFRYQTGLLTFEPAIEGSLASMDAALTDKNPLVIAVRLGSEFVREIAGIVPARDSDDVISVKIDDVLDVAAEKYHQVTGGKRFQVTGKNISARGEGEGLAVAGPDGVAHPCTVVEEDGMGQRIVAEAPVDADVGRGAILLTTRGYATPDTEPMLVKKPVTVVAAKPTPAKPPKVTLICADDREGEPEYADKLVEGQGVHFFGENLAGVTSLKMQYCKASDGNPHDKVIDLGLISYDGTGHLTLGTDFWSAGWADDWDRGSSCRFTLTTAGGTVTHDAYAYAG